MCYLRTVAVLLHAFATLGWTWAASDDVTYQVVFANVLHRHGDRTPAYFYPNDPYNNASIWPEAMGQLTNVGKQQMYDLGQWLGQRYHHLLGDSYSPDLVYVRSTDKDRTLMSAQCVTAGMFPPLGAQKWDDLLDWQPIPVHTTPLQLDKVLAQPPKTPCPAYEQELQNVFTTDEKIKQLNETYSKLLQWTSEKAGAPYNLLTLYNVYDTLFIESLYNMSLPQWTFEVFPEPMRLANVYNYMLETWTPKLARLQTGLLVQEMLQHLVDKAQNKTSRRLHLYSGHDETLVNLMNALGAFNYILPPYAACLMMELAVDSNGSYFVSLLYRNSTSEEPYLLTMAGCSPRCPLDQFVDVTRDLIPQDWDQECALPDDGQTSGWSRITYWLIGGAVVVVVVLSLLVVYRCACRKHRV